MTKSAALQTESYASLSQSPPGGPDLFAQGSPLSSPTAIKAVNEGGTASVPTKRDATSPLSKRQVAFQVPKGSKSDSDTPASEIPELPVQPPSEPKVKTAPKSCMKKAQSSPPIIRNQEAESDYRQDSPPRSPKAVSRPSQITETEDTSCSVSPGLLILIIVLVLLALCPAAAIIVGVILSISFLWLLGTLLYAIPIGLLLTGYICCISRPDATLD